MPALPLPSWARDLIRAAGIRGQLNDRAPHSPLFPLITARDGEQLRLTAAGIRYHLNPTCAARKYDSVL
jgi:hypothetical protein